MLLKPGVEPVPGLFGWNRLRLLLAELVAILRNLIASETRIVAGVTYYMMPSVTNRLTTMPA